MLKSSRGQRKTAGYRQLLLPNMLANSSENVDNAAAAADDDDDYDRNCFYSGTHTLQTVIW